MQQILEAIKRGPRETAKAVGSFPHRHPGTITGMLVFLVIILTGAQLHTSNQIEVLRRESSVCKDTATLRECAAELREALISCADDRRCHAALMAAVRSKRWLREVMPHNPSSKAGQQPGPADGAGSGAPAVDLPPLPIQIPSPELRLPELCAAGAICVGR